MLQAEKGDFVKILIIGFAKIKYMPYLNLYLENIDANKNDVHLIYWNRDLVDEDVSHIKNATLHEFKCYQEDDVSRFKKVKSFLKFRKFTKSIIKKEKFDFLISLTSVVSVLLSDVLTQKYKNKYFFDYRDATYESFTLYKKIIQNIAKNSCLTFVSSDAFRRYFLSEHQNKIYTTYNLLEDSLNHRDEKRLFGITSPKIRISFWGFIRHTDINIQIIKRLSNDNRFELHYYGREQETARCLKTFVKENDIKNVFFHGEYKPEDRYEFVRNTDIIHNIYDGKNMMFAMGNKYYDGVIFRIPQLCIKDSFMGAVAEKNNIGKQIHPNNPNFANEIYEYYLSLDECKFNESCDNYLNEIVAANNRTRLKINSIFD